MDGFANLRRAFLCQGEPSYVPALEYTVDDAIQTRLLGWKPQDIDDRATFFLSAGYDFVPVDFGMPRWLFKGTIPSGDGKTPLKKVKRHYQTDRRATSTRRWAEARQGVITDHASLDHFAWPEAVAEPYHDVARLSQILPPEVKVIPLLGYIFAGTWMLMGFDRFCVDLAGGGQLATVVMEKIGRFHCQVVENLLQFNCVGAICMPDDLAFKTGLMVKPSFLREHVFPWHQRIGELVRAKGLPYLFHSDGCYASVIDDLLECGYHAIHPCEPASFDITELKRLYGGRLCLCGNIDLDSTLTLGSPEDVDREVKMRMCTIAPGGGYCCGSSNSVTEYVPLENYRAMLAATKKYGRYPINLDNCL